MVFKLKGFPDITVSATGTIRTQVNGRTVQIKMPSRDAAIEHIKGRMFGPEVRFSVSR